MAKLYTCVLSFFLLAALPLPAQAPGLSDVYAQIRAEETNNSKIMWIIHEIADVYGPRVTGTPNLKAADDWAVKTMTSWGLANAHLEAWGPFGRGWSFSRLVMSRPLASSRRRPMARMAAGVPRDVAA